MTEQHRELLGDAGFPRPWDHNRRVPAPTARLTHFVSQRANLSHQYVRQFGRFRTAHRSIAFRRIENGRFVDPDASLGVHYQFTKRVLDPQ